MTTVPADEGRRVLRNVASFGAFVMSPVLMFLLIRALGPDGYGRWWWTFVLLEAGGILGNLGSELYVRREVPRLTREGRDDEVMRVVGSAIAVAGTAGLVICGVQIALAGTIADAQGDPALAPFLAILALQPVLWAIGGLLGAALQSRDVLTSLAVLRGIVMPLVQAGALFLVWRQGLATGVALLLLLAVAVLGLVLTAVLYARHLSLVRTLGHVLRPQLARQTLRYGIRLFVPLVLFTLGGKLDLYVLGAYGTPLLVGVYAACLQMGSSVPNTRALFDPIVQAQIGALYTIDKRELAASLRRLARLCAFGLAPAFVVTIAVGEPILGFLIGRPVPIAVAPLAILSVGQLLASIAVSAWLLPMMFAGRLLAVVAVIAGIVKLALLLLLVPPYGMIGAAIATSVGTIMAWFGQALFGERDLGHRPYSADVVPIVLASLMLAAGGRALFVVLRTSQGELVATGLAGVAVLAGVVAMIPLLLKPSERAQLRRFLHLGP